MGRFSGRSMGYPFPFGSPAPDHDPGCVAIINISQFYSRRFTVPKHTQRLYAIDITTGKTFVFSSSNIVLERNFLSLRHRKIRAQHYRECPRGL